MDTGAVTACKSQYCAIYPLTNVIIADFHDDFCTIRRDMIGENRTGALIPPRSVKSFAEDVKPVRAHRTMRKTRMGSKRIIHFSRGKS